MTKHLVHTIAIAANRKLQFSIELPSNVKKVTGVLVMISESGLGTHGSKPHPRKAFEGSIWLRSADKRDVFFAENVKERMAINFDAPRIDNYGFLNSAPHWLKGEMPEYFKIEVPVKNTIIEGYYEDHFNKQMKGYSLVIYLATEL